MQTPYNQLDTQKIEILTTAIYVGYAQRGTTPNAAVAEWTIKKITLDASGNPTDIKWTAETSAVWDNRASETYT